MAVHGVAVTDDAGRLGPGTPAGSFSTVGWELRATVHLLALSRPSATLLADLAALTSEGGAVAQVRHRGADVVGPAAPDRDRQASTVWFPPFDPLSSQPAVAVSGKVPEDSDNLTSVSSMAAVVLVMKYRGPSSAVSDPIVDGSMGPALWRSSDP
ncbi:MAG: hypothetical protein ACLQCU_05925 [Acidimicrobiales bacterium]